MSAFVYLNRHLDGQHGVANSSRAIEHVGKPEQRDVLAAQRRVVERPPETLDSLGSPNIYTCISCHIEKYRNTHLPRYRNTHLPSIAHEAPVQPRVVQGNPRRPVPLQRRSHTRFHAAQRVCVRARGYAFAANQKRQTVCVYDTSHTPQCKRR